MKAVQRQYNLKIIIKFMRLNNTLSCLDWIQLHFSVCKTLHSVIFDILPIVTTFFELGLNMLYIHFDIFHNYHEDI